jgi:hypothetical protein
MKKLFVVAAFLLLLLIVTGCGPSEVDLAETEAVVLGTSQAKSTNTARVEQTSAAGTQQFLDAQETYAAETAQAATATWEFNATQTADEATRQANAQNTMVARTQEAAAQATEAVSEIYAVVQALYEAGHISRTDGSFQQLPYFDESWAQIGYFYIAPIMDSFVEDFVLLVDVSWEASSQATEFYRAGCGVSFRVADDLSEYYTFMLGLDGNMNFFPKLASSNSVRLSKAYFGPIEHMAGSTTFIITAEGNKYQVFNEDLKRIDLRNGAELGSGYLAYQLASGSNTDFGTHCVFSDTDLWRLD